MTSRAGHPWTTTADIHAAVSRRWKDGSLLRAYGSGQLCPGVDLPLRGPRTSEIGEHLADVQAWCAELEAGSREGTRYELVLGEVGGRAFGRNRMPRRVRLVTYAQVWALLGVTGEVARFDTVLRLTGDLPAVRAWAITHPHRAIALADDWQRILAAYDWLGRSRGSGRYLREIAVPGVDTKFVERHRQVLGDLLGVRGTSTGFLLDLGLQTRPDLVRFRPDASLGLPRGLTEMAGRLEEVAGLGLPVRRAVIVENEITYLTMPVPSQGLVVWGRGFEADRIGSLPFLADAEVAYWGDLDTHGFAILDRLRGRLPQTRSFLMDRDTLLAHRDRWVREDRPTQARLDHLTAEEAAVYGDLVSDRYDGQVRLEQERIAWSWARERLPFGG